MGAVEGRVKPPRRGLESNPYGGKVLSSFEHSGSYDSLRAMGGMGALAVRAVRLAVVPPYPWLKDAVALTSASVRKTLVPLFVSHGVYAMVFGLLLLGQILESLGVSDRQGAFISLVWTREGATWITAMIFAGVIGSAITADLGARKVRDELDALAVLGVEQTRTLLVPRIVAATIAMPVLSVLSVLMVNAINLALAPGFLGYSRSITIDAIGNSVLPVDILFPLLLKNTVIGFFVGVVACYKGVSCGAGAESVGRAVNQAVVITFFGIWLFNTFFNFAFVTSFPDTQAVRG